MSRRWVRAEIKGLRCGSCTEPIPVGDALCLLVTDQHTFRRCTKCVGPAPADLPAVKKPGLDQHATQPTVSRSGVPALPYDGKAAAAGED